MLRVLMLEDQASDAELACVSCARDSTVSPRLRIAAGATEYVCKADLRALAPAVRRALGRPGN